MSYLVIARKWRPMNFDDMVGQEHVVITLKNAIETNRIAHAYIFSGPRGIGKTTAARIFAKAINCEQGGPTIHPCNQCQNCIEITASRSLDVLEIDGASNRGIDEIRNLRDNIRYLPLRGGYKIYIIDEFHMITKDAFNALLKTLEEPPEKVIFIFATTEPHKILPTILSRCQRLDFRRIPLSKIILRLRYICDQEKITIDDESLYLIAQKSDGAMRDALTLLDQVISFSGGSVSSETTQQALGLINTQLFFDLTKIIQERRSESVFGFVRALQNAGYDITEFLNGYLEHIRNLLVAKTCSDPDLLESSENTRTLYVSAAEHFSEADLIRMMNIITETLQRIKWSQKQKLLFELTLLKLTHMPDSVSVQQIINQINLLTDGQTETGETQIKKKVNPLKSSSVEAEESKSPLYTSLPNRAESPIDEKIEIVKSHWEAFVEHVVKERISLGTVLKDALPESVDRTRLIIRFTNKNYNEFHATIVHQEQAYLKTIWEQLTGEGWLVCCESNPASETQPQNSSESPKENQSSARTYNRSYSLTELQRQNIEKVRQLEQNGLLKNLNEILQAEFITVME